MIKAKERPIVLTAQEVNAVLVGDKTQHRVPVDIDHSISLTYHSLEAGGASPERIDALPFECPLGNVGDRLWVQEEHRPTGWSFDDGDVRIQYKDGKNSLCEIQTWEEVESNPNDDYLIAICDELINRNVPMKEGTDCFDMEDESNLPHWRSADVMPKFASRILLEITNIRIERIKDISEADAKAMGLKPDYCDHKYQSCKDIGCIGKWAEPLMNYFIHEKNIANVSCRDWVWVIEFKVVEPSEVVDG